MAYIKVDHSKLKSAASAIETYASTLKTKMKKAQSEAESLSAVWQGGDATEFKTRFAKIDNKDSTHAQFVVALESYAKYLKYAESEYKKAQSKAINRANNLPKY